MHLNIFASPNCFVHCKGCYSYSREENSCDMLETEKIIIFLKYAFEKGVRNVTFCGGDPLLRKDIMELLEKTKKLGYRISIDSIGTTIIKKVEINNNTFNKTNTKKLVELVDEIGIPIDGSNSEIMNFFRQSDGNILEEQLKICNELNKYGGNICINTVVHKKNIDDCLNLLYLINDLKFIKKWQLFQFIPAGKYGALNRFMFEISDEEFRTYKKTILKNQNMNNKIEFKDRNSRSELYMLIDNSGNAWLQSYKDNNIYNRVILGNICKLNDWDKIINYIKKGI